MAAVVLLLAAGANHLNETFRGLVTLASGFVDADHSETNLYAQLFKLGHAALVVIIPSVCVAALAAIFACGVQVGFKIAMKPCDAEPDRRPSHDRPEAYLLGQDRDRHGEDDHQGNAHGGGHVRHHQVAVPVDRGSARSAVAGPRADDVGHHGAPAGRRDRDSASHRQRGRQTAVDGIYQEADESKDEVKRENKQREGDPRIKHERKRIARSLVETAVQAPVALANVMLVNPTHYAVALRDALPYICCRA